jgi:hypothetical protein
MTQAVVEVHADRQFKLLAVSDLPVPDVVNREYVNLKAQE